MPKKEIVQVNLAAANPNLSPATRFGNLVFVAGQTGRHPITGEVGSDVREQTRYAIERIKQIARYRSPADTSPMSDSVAFSEGDILDTEATGVVTARMPNVLGEDTWDLFRILLR